jgi:molybdopterin-binding protein
MTGESLGLKAASELCLKIGDSGVALLKSSQVMILRNQI